MGLDISGIGSAITAVSDIVGKFVPDANQAGQLKAELTKTLIEQQDSLFSSAKDVALADAQSEGWMTRSARPFTVFWCLFIITWIAILAPLAGNGVAQATVSALNQVPGSLWALLSAGIGAYPLLRAVEKVTGGKK